MRPGRAARDRRVHWERGPVRGRGAHAARRRARPRHTERQARRHRDAHDGIVTLCGDSCRWLPCPHPGRGIHINRSLALLWAMTRFGSQKPAVANRAVLPGHRTGAINWNSWLVSKSRKTVGRAQKPKIDAHTTYAPFTAPRPLALTQYMRASATPMTVWTLVPSLGAVATPTLALTCSFRPFFIRNSVSINAFSIALACSSAAFAPV